MSTSLANVLTLRDTPEDVVVAVLIPRNNDPWGSLAPLRGTPWGELVREVSGEAMAHARHGFSTPLLRELGPPPKVLARRIPVEVGWCALSAPNLCAGASTACRVGAKTPDCFVPRGLDGELAGAVSDLVILIRDGARVVAVVGGEFSIG